MGAGLFLIQGTKKPARFGAGFLLAFLNKPWLIR